MKKFCVTLCILLFCNLLLAQDNRQEKRLLKSLKKSMDYMMLTLRGVGETIMRI